MQKKEIQKTGIILENDWVPVDIALMDQLLELKKIGKGDSFWLREAYGFRWEIIENARKKGYMTKASHEKLTRTILKKPRWDALVPKGEKFAIKQSTRGRKKREDILHLLRKTGVNIGIRTYEFLTWGQGMKPSDPLRILERLGTTLRKNEIPIAGVEITTDRRLKRSLAPEDSYHIVIGASFTWEPTFSNPFLVPLALTGEIYCTVVSRFPFEKIGTIGVLTDSIEDHVLGLFPSLKGRLRSYCNDDPLTTTDYLIKRVLAGDVDAVVTNTQSLFPYLMCLGVKQFNAGFEIAIEGVSVKMSATGLHSLQYLIEDDLNSLNDHGNPCDFHAPTLLGIGVIRPSQKYSTISLCELLIDGLAKRQDVEMEDDQNPHCDSSSVDHSNSAGYWVNQNLYSMVMEGKPDSTMPMAHIFDEGSRPIQYQDLEEMVSKVIK